MRGDGNVNLNFISSLQPGSAAEQSMQCFLEQLSGKESQAKVKDVSDCGMMAQDKEKRKRKKKGSFPIK